MATEFNNNTLIFYSLSTVTGGGSDGWQSAYTTVRSNSAQWASNVDTGVRALTSGLAATSYVHTNFVPVSGGTITCNLSVLGNISAQSSTVPVSVIDLTTNKTFLNSDTNKIFHFNNSIPLSAIFPNSLLDGFNVALMNTGTSTLHLSTNSNYRSIGNVLKTQYAGAYVYKANSQIFAVGGF